MAGVDERTSGLWTRRSGIDESKTTGTEGLGEAACSVGMATGRFRLNPKPNRFFFPRTETATVFFLKKRNRSVLIYGKPNPNRSVPNK